MVKPVYFALQQAIQTTMRSITPRLIRLQHGFMPEKNLEEIESMLQELQKTIHDMKTKQPPIVPLK